MWKAVALEVSWTELTVSKLSTFPLLVLLLLPRLLPSFALILVFMFFRLLLGLAVEGR